MSDPLHHQHCIPCEGGMPVLAPEAVEDLALHLGHGWSVVDGHHLLKRFVFPDFAAALAFTDAVGALAEAEGHHPEILLGWGYAELRIWTHAIDGLHTNDFILAAKVEEQIAAG